MTDSQSQQRTAKPDRGEVRRYWSTDDHHEMYVWGVRGGYQLATKDSGDVWEFGEVTESWSPPSKFYDKSEEVDKDEFPR